MQSQKDRARATDQDQRQHLKSSCNGRTACHAAEGQRGCWDELLIQHPTVVAEVDLLCSSSFEMQDLSEWNTNAWLEQRINFEKAASTPSTTLFFGLKHTINNTVFRPEGLRHGILQN